MDSTKKIPKEIRSKEEIAGRNVAIYLNLASVSFFIELHAAMVRDLLSRGNKVTAYLCDESFRSPMDNPFNRNFLNRYRMFRGKDAVRGLDIKLKIIDLNGASDKVSEKTAAALEIGTMSSFASMLKAQNKEELPPKWLRAYYNMFASAKKLYNYFVTEIKNEHYDFIFMLNGRFGCTRPALEAARDSNIGFGLYENNASINEIVFVNELIHSIEGNTRKAHAFYELDKTLAEKRAEDYFIKKTQNKYTGEKIYTKQQQRGSLPGAIEHTQKKIIAVYPTTEDEFKFIGKEWDGRVVESQVDEIDKLAEYLSPDKYILVVKMHPNQVFTAENTIEKYVRLTKKYPHVIVEKPLSKKDTYALMRRADVIVTFASTIGIEASYAGKPVILIGDTKWGNMDIAHKVYSAEEAAKLIEDGIGPKAILGAIIWGNYISTYKDRLPAFRIEGKGDYLVDGRRIGRSAMRRVLQLPAKLEIYLNSPGFYFNKLFFKKIFFTLGQIIKRK